MNISNETINKLAQLSKLSFNEKEMEAAKNDMQKMLNFVDKINELNTDNIEPLIHMNSQINVLREDVVVESITQQEALKNAPSKDSDYFKISKVLDN